MPINLFWCGSVFANVCPLLLADPSIPRKAQLFVPADTSPFSHGCLRSIRWLILQTFWLVSSIESPVQQGPQPQQHELFLLPYFSSVLPPPSSFPPPPGSRGVFQTAGSDAARDCGVLFRCGSSSRVRGGRCECRQRRFCLAASILLTPPPQGPTPAEETGGELRPLCTPCTRSSPVSKGVSRVRFLSWTDFCSCGAHDSLYASFADGFCSSSAVVLGSGAEAGGNVFVCRYETNATPTPSSARVCVPEMRRLAVRVACVWVGRGIRQKRQ